jgi:hypothetical protein
MADAVEPWHGFVRLDRGGRADEGRQECSFFEKKEPKKLYASQRHFPHSVTEELKVFCFFSSEKKILASFF